MTLTASFARIMRMKNNKKRATGRREAILVSVILFMALLIFLIGRLSFGTGTLRLEISVDGNTIKTFSLDADQEYLLRVDDDSFNRLVIRDGSAWISEASCPDKLCVHQGKIRNEGEMIVCLPNRMIAKITITPQAP